MKTSVRLTLDGFIVWEFDQRSRRALFFGLDDIVATLVGLLVGWGMSAVVSSGRRV